MIAISLIMLRARVSPGDGGWRDGLVLMAVTVVAMTHAEDLGRAHTDLACTIVISSREGRLTVLAAQLMYDLCWVVAVPESV